MSGWPKSPSWPVHSCGSTARKNAGVGPASEPTFGVFLTWPISSAYQRLEAYSPQIAPRGVDGRVNPTPPFIFLYREPPMKYTGRRQDDFDHPRHDRARGVPARPAVPAAGGPILPGPDLRRRRALADERHVPGAIIIRLPLRSTAQLLYTSVPIIFSECFSKVTIGFIPRRTKRCRRPARGRACWASCSSCDSRLGINPIVTSKNSY